MFSYLKVPPTTYVLHYSGGKVKRQGAGLSYFYFAPSAEIVLVPLTSTDVPFVFNEVTADFQDATIQGELTYRITNAKRVAEVLDYSVDSRQKYRSEDPTKLGDRLVNSAQILARSFTQKRPLAEVLNRSRLPRISRERQQDRRAERVAGFAELLDEEGLVLLGNEKSCAPSPVLRSSPIPRV